MSWFDDLLDFVGGGENVDLALGDIGSDVTMADIVGGTENVLDTNDYQSNNGNPMYGADSPNEPTQPSYDGYTTGTGYTNGEDGGITTNPTEPKSLSAKGDAGDEKGMFGKATDFIDKNKKLTDMGVGLIGGMYSSSQKKKEDAKAYERMLEKRAYDEKIQKEKEDRADARRGGGGGSSAMEMLAAKDALEQAKNARYSASITGLKPQGLINKGRKLTYVGGKPVYTDSGSLA
jgi:hypothetical protein